MISATKHSKIFPGVASESDLQRWRASKERKSPSLSQMGSDSVKHKVSKSYVSIVSNIYKQNRADSFFNTIQLVYN